MSAVMNMPPIGSARSSVDAAEIARFAAVAERWWAARGEFAPLHRLNPVRLAFIRDTALARFQRTSGQRRPFAGLTLLDVGCGGGLVCEPMTRLGFAVTGLDADRGGCEAAAAHAAEQSLAIDYRAGAVEDLVGGASTWDVVLALEVIEHVAAPASFLSDCAALVTSGGLLIVSTINRTARSLMLAKFAAEHLLRWAPRGTHDWRRFVSVPEMLAMAPAGARVLAGPSGLVFDPLRGDWRRSTDVSVNYVVAFGLDP